MYCQQSRSNRCGWIEWLGLFQRRTPHVGLRADASRREDETDRCPSSMDRRKRGKRKSWNCFERCLTFSFVRFMADPEMEVDSRKLKVKERQNSRKKRHNTENTECRGTKGTEGMTIPGIRAGPKNKNAPTVVGAHFSTGSILPEPYLVCQEENARKRAEARWHWVVQRGECKLLILTGWASQRQDTRHAGNALA